MQQLCDVYKCLGRWWRLRWENIHKEPMWRLLMQGVRGAGGHDICPAGACPCGWQLPAAYCASPAACSTLGAPALRMHYFWQCPVACAVVRQVQSQLPAGRQLACSSLWLGVCPDAAVHAGVWDVVCLAAVAAMEHGRKLMWRLHLQAISASAANSSGRQATLHELWHLPDPSIGVSDVVQYAARAAAADFWGRLQDFADLDLPASRWPAVAYLGPHHPYLCKRVVTDGSDVQRICVNAPSELHV
jgi:hypothetical protein